MKRFLVLLLVGLLILTSCLPWKAGGRKEIPVIKSPEPLCANTGELDFTILDEVREIIRDKSIHKEAAADTKLLLNGAFDSFFASISVPQSEIPQWARDMVDEELKKGENARLSILGGIQQRLGFQDKNFLIKNSISGILKALGDNFGAYHTPLAWKADKGDLSGRYQGIGVQLKKSDSREIVIDDVFTGSPAKKAGILAGDAILEIDNKYLTPECSIEDVRFKILIRDDPMITMKIRRAGEERLFKFKTSEVIIKHVISSPVIDFPEDRGSSGDGYPYSQHPFKDRDGKPAKDILYVKIREFTNQSFVDLGFVLLALNPNKFEGIIIDLRGNPGGITSSVAISAGFFLENGFVFLGEGRDYSIRHYLTKENIYFENSDGKLLTIRRLGMVPQKIPITVLTGADDKDKDAKNSYSAAEIFAAALRDNNRAVIVSREERTGGKGTFNQNFPLKNGEYGALYLSIGFWKTPNGESIQGIGLKPDIKVDWSEADFERNKKDRDYDPTLFAAIDYLKIQSQMGVAK